MNNKRIRKFHIYALLHPETNKPFYVGMTSNLKLRAKVHKCAWRKKILVTPVFEVLETVKGLKKGRICERKWVSHMVSLYGDAITNKWLVPKVKIVKELKTYKKLDWVFLEVPEIIKIGSGLSRKHFIAISNDCGYSEERIRQIFSKRITKIHPKVYASIIKIQEK